jgi:hypothetical protein
MNDTSMNKGLNADLENFELTDIMQLITQQVKCGALTVENGPNRCSWFFDDGKLINFEAHFPDFSVDLESILIKSGHLTRSQCEHLQEKHPTNSSLELEKVLLREKLITREKLENINLHRLIETFIITLQWRRGHYEFIPTGEVGEYGFFPPQDTNFVILEALRQIDEMAVMKKRLGALDRVFETTLTQAVDSEHLDEKEKKLFTEGLQDQFDRDELEVYLLFDGQRSVEDVLNSSSLGQFNTYRIILDFLDREILAPPAGDLQVQESSKKGNGFFRYSPAFVLITLNLSLVCALAFFASGYRFGQKESQPTFIQAIIENIKTDQEKSKIAARRLLSPTKIEPPTH